MSKLIPESASGAALVELMQAAASCTNTPGDMLDLRHLTQTLDKLAGMQCDFFEEVSEYMSTLHSRLAALSALGPATLARHNRASSSVAPSFAAGSVRDEDEDVYASAVHDIRSSVPVRRAGLHDPPRRELFQPEAAYAPAAPAAQSVHSHASSVYSERQPVPTLHPSAVMPFADEERRRKVIKDATSSLKEQLTQYSAGLSIAVWSESQSRIMKGVQDIRHVPDQTLVNYLKKLLPPAVVKSLEGSPDFQTAASPSALFAVLRVELAPDQNSLLATLEATSQGEESAVTFYWRLCKVYELHKAPYPAGEIDVLAALRKFSVNAQNDLRLIITDTKVSGGALGMNVLLKGAQMWDAKQGPASRTRKATQVSAAAVTVTDDASKQQDRQQPQQRPGGRKDPKSGAGRGNGNSNFSRGRGNQQQQGNSRSSPASVAGPDEFSTFESSNQPPSTSFSALAINSIGLLPTCLAGARAMAAPSAITAASPSSTAPAATFSSIAGPGQVVAARVAALQDELLQHSDLYAQRHPGINAVTSGKRRPAGPKEDVRTETPPRPAPANLPELLRRTPGLAGRVPLQSISRALLGPTTLADLASLLDNPEVLDLLASLRRALEGGGMGIHSVDALAACLVAIAEEADSVVAYPASPASASSTSAAHPAAAAGASSTSAAHPAAAAGASSTSAAPLMPLSAYSPVRSSAMSAPAYAIVSSPVAPSSYASVTKGNIVQKGMCTMPFVNISLGVAASTSPDLLRQASIDTGAGMCCISELAFQRDRVTLLKHATLRSLAQPMIISMFGGQQVQVTQVLRDVRVHIGQGWYDLHLLIVPGAMHEYLLAGDFLCNYDAYVHYKASRFNLGLPSRQRTCGPAPRGGYQSVRCEFTYKWARQDLVEEKTGAGGAASSP